MNKEKKVIYYVCTNEGSENGSIEIRERPGTASKQIWEILMTKNILSETDITFDNKPVMVYQDENNNSFYFAQSDVPICWDYPKYLPEMNEKFSDFDFAGMVTWHEGASAPPKVLTVHSVGDVNEGIYGSANPKYMRNLMLAIEKNRIKHNLEDFHSVVEATHWSGTTVNGHSPKLILEYPVPIIDIEVGSIKESWENEIACTVIAESLFKVFEEDDSKVHNILCIGGMHFDPNFSQAIFTEWNNDAFGVSHIIANQWLVSGKYEEEHGIEFTKSAIEAIEGGVELIVFHDGLKSHYKTLAKTLGEMYNIPAVMHRKIRNPENIGL